MQCDLCVAAEHARFAITEVKVGRGAPWAAPLPWLIPPRVAMQILLTGDPVSARRAHEIGLVNDVVPAAELQAAAQRLAERIAANAPLSVLAAKRTVRLVAEQPLSAGVRGRRADLGAGVPERGRAGRPGGVPRQAAARLEGALTGWPPTWPGCWTTWPPRRQVLDGLVAGLDEARWRRADPVARLVHPRPGHPPGLFRRDRGAGRDRPGPASGPRRPR